MDTSVSHTAVSCQLTRTPSFSIFISASDSNNHDRTQAMILVMNCGASNCSLSVAKERTSMIGKTISHYQIIDKLGQGGMGEVYKARDTRLNRFVAIKSLPPDRGSDRGVPKDRRISPGTKFPDSGCLFPFRQLVARRQKHRDHRVQHQVGPLDTPRFSAASPWLVLKKLKRLHRKTLQAPDPRWKELSRCVRKPRSSRMRWLIVIGLFFRLDFSRR